jgi:hypothetical protein
MGIFFPIYSNKQGLFTDDLIPEQNDIVKEALRRLPKQDGYDRMFRIRRATSAGINMQELEPSDWVQPSEVYMQAPLLPLPFLFLSFSPVPLLLSSFSPASLLLLPCFSPPSPLLLSPFSAPITPTDNLTI